MITKRLACLLAVAVCAGAHAQKFDGLALTPPMGWNSWNHFGCDINEQLIHETADAMVATGMKDAGYEYINIDDCWHGERDGDGVIHPDPARFPNGIKALADYVHSKGLKLGIYSDVGYKTCGGKPGSRGHEFQDAITYAQWGIDYLKYDWCNSDHLDAEGAYTTMRDALYSAGRPIVFSLCEWGQNKPWLWAGKVGNLWRTTGDICACFDCTEGEGGWHKNGVLQNMDLQVDLRQYAGPGHWNDPDMLEVGNGMTTNEDRAHFSMWCMLAAPLITGNDLRHMDPETLDILTNKAVIAIDQDALGIEGYKNLAQDGVEVWFKPLTNGDWAMCVLNRNTTPRDFKWDWSAKYIDDSLTHHRMNFRESDYHMRNLWTGEDMGPAKGATISKTISGHDVLLVRLTK